MYIYLSTSMLQSSPLLVYTQTIATVDRLALIVIFQISIYGRKVWMTKFYNKEQRFTIFFVIPMFNTNIIFSIYLQQINSNINIKFLLFKLKYITVICFKYYWTI